MVFSLVLLLSYITSARNVDLCKWTLSYFDVSYDVLTGWLSISMNHAQRFAIFTRIVSGALKGCYPLGESAQKSYADFIGEFF